MKLFAIRLENGQTAITLADNSEAAIKEVGLTDEVFRQLEQQGCKVDYPQLVYDGVGPQLYELIELSNFCIRLGLTEDGNYFISDIDELTYSALSKLCPVLEKAMSEISEKFSSQMSAEDRAEYRRMLKRAVSHERTRLMLPRKLTM